MLWNLEDQYKNDPNFEELQVFEKTETDFILYSRRKPIGPITTARDSLLKMTKVKRDDGKVLIITSSVKRDDLMPEKEGIIRMDHYKASLFEQKGDDLHLVDFTSTDMKGYYPPRLMNMIMAGMVPKGIKGLYAKMKAMPIA